MASPSWELQRALHQSLVAHAPLLSGITGVYDAPPQDAPVPYVVIGDDVVTDWSAKGLNATEHRLAIHVWTRGPGKREAKTLLADVEAALATVPPAPAGYRLISLRMLQSTVLTDADGLTQHGIIEFRGRLCPL